MSKFYFRSLFVLGIVLTLILPSYSQTTAPVVKITYPQSRAVFQRENDNTSTIYFSGNFYQPTDSLQVRLQAEAVGQGINTNWTTIVRNPQGGVFTGKIKAQGGWYRLEIQAFSAGKIIGSDVLRKVGIGEVFIITGQSNAQGFFNYGAVGAADDRVNCVTYDNRNNSLDDPPTPSFQQLSANSLIGPRGQSAWCWGVMGDLIAQQYNVPVLFINTAWQATVIQNWHDSADGLPAKNIFAIGTPDENFPTGMPYGNLIISLRYYTILQGVRAILWQQGENDNVPMHSTREAYRANMQYIINKTRSDTRLYPAWVLARSSYNLGQISDDIIQAQNDVINTYNNNVYPGPETDKIQIPRYQGDVHFGGDGLKQLGQAWFESLSKNSFFTASRPTPPLPQPDVTVVCTSTNNGVTITLPSLYKSYNWRSGQKTQTLTVTQPGVYQATVKDEFGRTFLTPTIEVAGPIQPTVPTLALASNPTQIANANQQICADSTLTLIANTNTNSSALWNTNAFGKSITLSKAGNYSAQAVNIYGCKSANSTPLALTIQPKVPAPTIQQIGPYTLKASLPTTFSTINSFNWRRSGDDLSQTGSEIKVVVTATYQARAKATFTLGTNSITCFSDYSAPQAFAFSPVEGGLSIYPNPSKDGMVSIESIEDIENADIAVVSMTGQQVAQFFVPLFDRRQTLNLSGLVPGEYFIRVKGQNFRVSQRIIIMR